MAVAWIGNREVLVEHAVERAAKLLDESRCPVITLDTDIDGTRAAVALAERVGAILDHDSGGAGLARETALLTDKGGMFLAPGEVRRRSDLIVLAGDLPAYAADLLADLAQKRPDLGSGAGARTFFRIGGRGGLTLPAATVRLGDADAAATLAALRAGLAGRPTARPVRNLALLADALSAASFPVFLYSGSGLDAIGMEMLQGLVDDLNRKGRASTLFLPASESGWGSTLAAVWMTGFPLRTGFARGIPEFDPWRFDVRRMVGAGEADLHLRVTTAVPQRRASSGLPLIALAATEKPAAGAAVTLRTGVPGVDHDRIAYSARAGTITAAAASAASEQASAAALLRSILGRLSCGGRPC